MARWRASSSGAAAALTRRHVSFRPATPSFRATSTSSAPASASAPAAEAISFACTGDSSPARIAASTAGSSPGRAAVSSVAIAAPTDEPARRQPVGGGALTRASPEVGGGHPPRRQRLACGTQLLDGGEGVDQTRRRLGRQRLGLEGSHELAQLRFHLLQTHENSNVRGYSSRGNERMFDASRPQRQDASKSLEICAGCLRGANRRQPVRKSSSTRASSSGLSPWMEWPAPSTVTTVAAGRRRRSSSTSSSPTTPDAPPRTSSSGASTASTADQSGENDGMPLLSDQLRIG